MYFEMLSSKNYPEANIKDYGDCTVIIDKGEAVIYDCGSEEHAKKAMRLIKSRGISEAICILSHGDQDHIKGFEYLNSQGFIKDFFKIDEMNLKHQIKVKNNNLNTISNKIKDEFSNEEKLRKNINFKDIFKYESELPKFVKFVGPKKEYIVAAIEKKFDPRQTDTVDNTTVTNVTSVQLEVQIGDVTILLTGDSSADSIPTNVKLSNYDYIQLPHHGNSDIAEEIFERNKKKLDVVYLVSDNKGDAKGGSDKLKVCGHQVKNTKYEDVVIDDQTSKDIQHYTGKCLGCYE